MAVRLIAFAGSAFRARDRKITAGEPYIPPTERPGHRFYQRKQAMSESQRASLTKARAMRAAKFIGHMVQGEL